VCSKATGLTLARKTDMNKSRNCIVILEDNLDRLEILRGIVESLPGNFELRHFDSVDGLRSLASNGFACVRLISLDFSLDNSSASRPGTGSFIDGHLFHDRAGAADDLHDAVRFLAIRVHAGTDEAAVRAEPLGRAARHGRPDAKLAGLVARRADDATLGRRRTDDYGLAALWLVRDQDVDGLPGRLI
jgi:hypothetical protein